MTDVVVDRLHIRGSDPRRLATVGARALPGALESALADLADVNFDRLTVRLVDPAGYDDETLAVLWADGIRQAALAAGARVRTVSSGGGGRDDPAGRSGDRPTVRGLRAGQTPAVGVADIDDIAAVVTSWLAAGAAPVPAEVAGLSDPLVAAAVLRRIGDERATRLALALAAAAERLGMTWEGPGGRDAVAEPAGAFERPPHGRPDGAPSGAGGVPPSSESAQPALVDRVAGAARALCPLLELHPGAAVDPATATRVAGVVLAYPWLADLCREAADLHPDAEPSQSRRIALAALADPDDPDLVDDPLVRFLAGAPQEATPAMRLAPLDAVIEVRATAENVLRRFVALLPGFERSSAEFVREVWVRRPGLLDAEHDPATLVARSAPLDVVLPRLPYPVGVLRLPWTPVLTVRFRP